MKLLDKTFGVGRFVCAALPFVIVCYGSVLYARMQDANLEQVTRLERRLTEVEIDSARQDERTLAIVARIDAIDKTLWWLILATFGGTGVSGVVAADRAIYKWKAAK